MSKAETLSYLSRLEWRAGKLPDTHEAEVPEGFDAFELARDLRESDPQAAYACLEREGKWFVVAMPDEPPGPAQSSEPELVSVWRTRVYVYAEAAPQVRAEYALYGPTQEYLLRICRRLANIAPSVLKIGHDRISPVDFGEDHDPASLVNSLHPAWCDDGSNQVATVEAVGGIVKYVRRVYPRNVPTNEQLARELAKVFADDDEGGK